MAMDIYRLNKIGNATISTPIGNLGLLKVNEIVRQGTIIGPNYMLYQHRYKINNIDRKCIRNLGPNIIVEMLTYVDDINKLCKL